MENEKAIEQYTAVSRYLARGGAAVNYVLTKNGKVDDDYFDYMDDIKSKLFVAGVQNGYVTSMINALYQSLLHAIDYARGDKQARLKAEQFAMLFNNEVKTFGRKWTVSD